MTDQDNDRDLAAAGPPDPPPSPPLPPPPDAAPASSEPGSDGPLEQFCTSCGTALDEGQRFCPSCGKAVGQATGDRRGLAVLGIVAAGGFVVVAVVAGALWWTLRDGEKRHDITGAITLSDVDYMGRTEGSTCSGSGGYSDISGGTTVTVRDGKGEILGTGALESGRSILLGCEFAFEVKGVPERDFYSVEVGSGRRGSLSWSREELEDRDWTVELTLG